MKFNTLEKVVAALLLTAVVSTLYAHETTLVRKVKNLLAPTDAAPTLVRGLAEPQRESSQYLRRDAQGRLVKVDATARLVPKGTMPGARSDSYQAANYLNAQGLRPSPHAQAANGR